MTAPNAYSAMTTTAPSVSHKMSTAEWTLETRQEANRRRKDNATYTTPLMVRSSDAVFVTDFLSDFNRNLGRYEKAFQQDLDSNVAVAAAYQHLVVDTATIPRMAFIQRYFYRCTDPQRIATDLQRNPSKQPKSETGKPASASLSQPSDRNGVDPIRKAVSSSAETNNNNNNSNSDNNSNNSKGPKVAPIGSTSSSTTDSSDSSDDSSSSSSDGDDVRRRPQHTQIHSTVDGHTTTITTTRRPATTAVPYRSSSSAWSKNNYRSSSRIAPSVPPVKPSSSSNNNSNNNNNNNNNKPLKPSSRRRPSAAATARANFERRTSNPNRTDDSSLNRRTHTTDRSVRSSAVSSSASLARRARNISRSVSTDNPRTGTSDTHGNNDAQADENKSNNNNNTTTTVIRNKNGTNVIMDTTPSVRPSTFLSQQNSVGRIDVQTAGKTSSAQSSPSNSNDRPSFLKRPSLEDVNTNNNRPAILRPPSMENVNQPYNHSTTLRRPSMEHAASTTVAKPKTSAIIDDNPQIPPKGMWERRDSESRANWKTNNSNPTSNHTSSYVAREQHHSKNDTDVHSRSGTITSRFTNKSFAGTHTSVSRFSRTSNSNETPEVEDMAKMSVMEKAAAFQRPEMYQSKNNGASTARTKGQQPSETSDTQKSFGVAHSPQGKKGRTEPAAGTVDRFGKPYSREDGEQEHRDAASRRGSICNSSISTTPDHEELMMMDADGDNDLGKQPKMVVDTSAATKELNARHEESDDDFDDDDGDSQSSASPVEKQPTQPKRHTRAGRAAGTVKGSIRTEQVSANFGRSRAPVTNRYGQRQLNNRGSGTNRRHGTDEKTMYSVASTTKQREAYRRGPTNRGVRRGLETSNSRRGGDWSSSRQPGDRNRKPGRQSGAASVASRATATAVLPQRPALTKVWGRSARSINRVQMPGWIQKQQGDDGEQEKLNKEATETDPSNGADGDTSAQPMESAPTKDSDLASTAAASSRSTTRPGNPLSVIPNHADDTMSLPAFESSSKPKKSWKSKLAPWQKRDTPSDKETDSASLLVRSKKKWSSKAFGLSANDYDDDNDDSGIGNTKSDGAPSTNGDDDDLQTTKSSRSKEIEGKKRKSKTWGASVFTSSAVKPSAWGAKLPPWVKPGKSDKNKPSKPSYDDTAAVTGSATTTVEASQSTSGDDSKLQAQRDEDDDFEGGEEEVSLKDIGANEALDHTGKSLLSASLHSSTNSSDEGIPYPVPGRQPSQRWANGPASRRRSKSGMSVNLRQLAERSVVRAERRRNSAETYSREVNVSKLTVDEANEYREFVSGFKLQDWEDDIEITLVKYSTVQGFYTKMVPQTVDKQDFWIRYFFRCDEKRMLRLLRHKTSTGNRGIDRRMLEKYANADSGDELGDDNDGDANDNHASMKTNVTNTNDRTRKMASSRSLAASRRNLYARRDDRSVSPKPPGAAARRRPSSNVGPTIRERQKSFERKTHMRRSASSRFARGSRVRDRKSSDPPGKNGDDESIDNSRSKDHQDSTASTTSSDQASDDDKKSASTDASPTLRRANVRAGVSVNSRQRGHMPYNNNNNSGVKNRIKAFSTTRGAAAIESRS